VILYIILTKEFPFCETNEYNTFKSILKEKLRFPKSVELGKEVRHLLSRMLEKDPDLRYNMEDVKIHPWMANQFEDVDPGRKFFEIIEDNETDFYDDAASIK
jgi:serine/threonine protein kinase